MEKKNFIKKVIDAASKGRTNLKPPPIITASTLVVPRVIKKALKAILK